MRKLKFDGYWWLPENPSEQVAGTLSYSARDGISLSLFGVLGGFTLEFQNKAAPIILGTAFDCPLGREVTLKDCEVQRLRLGRGRESREAYHANRLFIGDHLVSAEEFKFSSVQLSLSGLASWADVLTGLRHQDMVFEIEYTKPEPITGPVPRGRLVLGVSTEMSLGLRKATITEDVGIHVNCDEPQSEEELNERYVYPLQNLLTLATDHPNAVLKCGVKRGDGDSPIHLFWPPVFYDARVAKDLTPYKMIFTLGDVRDRAVQLVANWIDLHHRFRRAVRPYFAIQYRPNTYTDVKYMTVFQSIEVYLREKWRQVSGHSSGSPEVTVEEVRQLLEEHKAAVGPLFRDDLDEAAKDLVLYRDYVVHRNSDLGESEGFSASLYWLLQKLNFLMKACLLAELGISEEERVSFLRRNQAYGHILRLEAA